VDPFTIIDYIKSSIEILMNMKIEEHRTKNNIIGGRVKDEDVQSNFSQTKENGVPTKYED